MTFKSIDLQMSVPRTQEFSGKQSQIMHKAVVDQNTLANQAAKNTEELRSKNTGIEQATGLHVRSDQGEQKGNAHPKASGKRQSDESEEQGEGTQPSHPFKGHSVDIKL